MANEENIPTSTNSEQDYDIVSLVPEETQDPTKTGPKPKRLVAVEVLGYEVGRGINRKVINPDDVYKLAAIGCTTTEISRWFSIPEQTIRYNFSEIIEKAREELKQSLRMAQLKLALSGNAVMLIWLGKNILGQQDNVLSNDDNKVLPWNDNEDIENKDLEIEDGTNTSNKE